MKLLNIYSFVFLCALPMCIHTKVEIDTGTTVPAKIQTSPINAKLRNTESVSKKSAHEDEDSDLIKPIATKTDEDAYPSDEDREYAEEEISDEDKKFFATEARLQEYFNKP